MPDTRQPPQHQQKPQTVPSQSHPRPEDVQPASSEKTLGDTAELAFEPDDDMDIPDIESDDGVSNLIESEREGRNRDNDVERLG